MRLSRLSSRRLFIGTLLIFFFTTSFLSISFAQDNQAPFTYAGVDVQAVEFETIQLDGSASFDVEFLELDYLWEQILGPMAILSNQDTPILTVQVPGIGSTDGIMTFRLTLTDIEGESSSDTANVFIRTSNTASVPEPSAVLLISFGLVMFVAVRRFSLGTVRER